MSRYGISIPDGWLVTGQGFMLDYADPRHLSVPTTRRFVLAHGPHAHLPSVFQETDTPNPSSSVSETTDH
jgi:hypothetical protein